MKNFFYYFIKYNIRFTSSCYFRKIQITGLDDIPKQSGIVFSPNHQRAAGSVVRFRGPPVVTSAGPGGANPDDIKNLQQFATIPTFDNVSDLNNTSGFIIALGQIDSSGAITGATTSDPLTDPINYFHITSTRNATSGGVSGGGENCSAGPVTLEVVNG